MIGYLTKNAANAQEVAVEAVRNIPDAPSPYASAMKNAIITDRAAISDRVRQKYALLVGEYL